MLADRYQIAEIFGVSAGTVRTWYKAGCPAAKEPETGPGKTAEDRKRLFETAAVHRWLIERALRW
jgi:phage terminase Nu1 subunit (DNA packaging protein)